jgi:pyridoxal biosynthesis lyase PdxS
MALERIPADIRRDGGVARMSDPVMIAEIQAAVSIPVMAKARIGHFVEAQILEALEVDYLDESGVLTPADEAHHIESTSSISLSCAVEGILARSRPFVFVSLLIAEVLFHSYA